MKKENFKNQKYNFLREKLDKLNYIQSFDLYSMELIETLLNDIMKNQNEISNLHKKQKQSSESNEEKSLTINALKYKINLILKENQDLHNEVINLMDKSSMKEESESIVKKSKEEIENMQFLISQYKNKINFLEKENIFLKKKQEKFITSLYDKSVNIKQIFESNAKEESKDSFEKNFNDLIESKKENFELTEVLSPMSSTVQFNNSMIQAKVNESLNMKKRESDIMISTMQSQIDKYEKELKDKENEIRILHGQMSKYFNYTLPTNNSLITSSGGENTYETLQMNIDFLKTEIKTQKDKYESYIKYLLDNQKNHYESMKELKIGKNEIMDKLKEENERLKNRIKNNLIIYNDLNQKNISLIKELNLQKELLVKKSKPSLKITQDNNITLLPSKQSQETPKFIQNENIRQQQEKIIKQNENLIKSITEKNKVLDLHNKELQIQLTELESSYSKLQDEFNSKMRTQLSNDLNDTELEKKINSLLSDKISLESTISSLNTSLSSHEKKLDMICKELIAKNSEISRLNNLNSMLETQIKIFSSS